MSGHIGRLLAATTAFCLLSGVAQSAERVVVMEDFNATWCGPCVATGNALSQLQNENPDTLAVIQTHISDIYTIPWGSSRASSYGVTAIPFVQIDGVQARVGSSPTIYTVYRNDFLARRAVATDVVVELGAQQVSGATFEVRARVSVEAGGQPRTFRMFFEILLDNYPELGSHYRNCTMAVPPTEDITLNPGESVEIARTVTFDAVSWARQTRLRIVGFAQAPGASGARLVYNARMINWPFPPLTPVHANGDMNCDGYVNFDDIDPFVMALISESQYVQAFPTCDRMLADCNDDGAVDFADIDGFVAALAGV